MLKKKTIFSLILSVLMFCICAIVASCGGDKTTKYAVTWDVNENAVVSVEGYEALPSEVDENTKITFTAEGKNGYQIENVSYELGGKTKKVPSSNGKYSVSVTAAVKIIVTVEPAIESVAVTTNPTNMTYYTGDVLDTTGMVVTVNYKTGTSEPITNYTVNYSTLEAAAFVCGDTGFTVSYRGITSAPVTFAAPVETKVVLDPAGGVISEEALTALSTATGINNYAVVDGKVTFTFANITEAVALPTDIAFPVEEGGWPFGNWQTAGGQVVEAISNETVTTSVVLTAKYQVQLIEVTSVYMGYEGTAPYLYVDVNFVNDGTVFLFLYEGNAQISLKGADVEGKQGEKKTISLELKQLAEATAEGYDSFEGKWMDIRINADIHGVVYTTNVVLDPTAAIAEVGDTAHDDANMYKLHYYMNGTSLELKVVYRPYKYSYTIEAKEVEGVPSLVIEGQLNTALVDDISVFANGTVTINWVTELTGTINADGSWKIVKALADLETAAVTAGTISFEAEDGTTFDVSTTAGTYLDLMQCETQFPYSNGEYTSHRSYALVEEIGGFIVAIGCDWTEPFLVVENIGTKITADKFELVVENDVPYGVITGTYGSSYTNETILEALAAMYLDIQQYNTWNRYINSSDGTNMTAVSVVANEGVYTIKIDLSGMDTQDGYYIHVADSSANWTAKEWTEGQEIVGAGKRYTLGLGTLSWAGSLMTIWVENAVNPEFAVTGATLEEKGGVAYLVLTGTWNTAACDAATATAEIANVTCDLQHHNSWEYIYPAPTGEANADGTFKIYLALTDATVNTFWYIHIGGDLKVPVSGTLTLTVGSYTYTLEQRVAEDWTNELTAVTVTEVVAAA